MMAANRVGKTEGVGGYEVVLHATGEYPDWWKGRRFERPLRIWAAGDTGETVREIVQEKLMGEPGNEGTGLIPADNLDHWTMKGGVTGAIDMVWVKHKSGGLSRIKFKSYDQKRKSFQGTEQDIIWLDEEPPLDIYTECLLRTTKTTTFAGGLILCTFTPLEGISEVVLKYLPGGSIQNEGGVENVVMASWDDVPHLSLEEKEDLKRNIPPYQLDARSKGIPQLGSGAIYPVPESDITCVPFEIPDYWPRLFGFDVGWKRTAAVWLAQDPDTKVWYVYGEYYKGQAEPPVHAAAVRSRGEWIPGEVDPAARGRSQADGKQLMRSYKDLGLNLRPADNTVEAGIFEVYTLLSTGQLKVFMTCQNWLSEFRLYRRDDKGNIVKENDHLMDGTRYAIKGRHHARTPPVDRSGSHRPASQSSITGV